MLLVSVKKLQLNAVLPKYATEGAAGFDLHSTEPAMIPPRGSVVVGTGLAFAIPKNFEMQIRSRSGLAFKQDVVAFHGTIDSDYRGEVKVKLFNNGAAPVYLPAGDRIAQGVINRVETAVLDEVSELDSTARGTDGFGSTGRN